MVFPLIHQAKTFPADYIYFNQISGGNKKAWSNYEYDYYFHGIKKSSEEIIAEIGNRNVTVASNCNLSNYFNSHPNIKFCYTPYFERSNKDWDYGLFGINYIPPDLLKSGKWKPAQIEKIFYHLGNPLVVIVKRTDKLDYDGISKLKENNLEEAKILLNRAVKTDQNNVWLFAQLAKISLKEDDFESFNRYLQQGREIYPHYETFYLLEAQQWFTKGNYNRAKEVLNNLFAVNPRYENANPLLEAVNEKLNKE